MLVNQNFPAWIMLDWTGKQKKNICDIVLSLFFSIVADSAIISAQRFLLKPEKHCNQVEILNDDILFQKK